VPQQALVVPCRLLALCHGSIQCLNKAFTCCVKARRESVCYSFWELQHSSVCHSAILGSDHGKSHSWKDYVVSVQHAETNTMKIMGSWYEHKCHDTSQCNECPWVVELVDQPFWYHSLHVTQQNFFFIVLKRFAEIDHRVLYYVYVSVAVQGITTYNFVQWLLWLCQEFQR
jgi:hypothetical protein